MSADLFGLAVTGQDVAPTPLGLGTAMATSEGEHVRPAAGAEVPDQTGCQHDRREWRVEGEDRDE